MDSESSEDDKRWWLARNCCGCCVAIVVIVLVILLGEDCEDPGSPALIYGAEMTSTPTMTPAPTMAPTKAHCEDAAFGRRRSRTSSSSRKSSSSGSSSSSSGSCLVPGTLVLTRDNARAIEAIRLGDVLRGGDVVEATMQLAGHLEPLYDVGVGPDGLVLGGSHTVRDPADGAWKHAADVVGAVHAHAREPVLFNLITSNHSMLIAAAEAGSTAPTAWLEATDYMEIDDDDALLEENLAALNRGADGGLGIGASLSPPVSARAGKHGGARVQRRLKTSCFPAGALVFKRVADAAAGGSANATVAVEDVRLGDVLVGGGAVTATMQFVGDGEDLYAINGAVVSGSHSVRDPADGGVWKHAEDAHAASRLESRAAVLYNFITEHHRVLLAGAPGAAEPSVEAADFLEVDEDAMLLARNLARLNEQPRT